LEEFGFDPFIQEFVSDGQNNYAFSVSYPIDRKTHNQIECKKYNIQFRKFRVCKLHHIEGYGSERHRQVSLSKKDNEQTTLCRIQTEIKRTMLFLRSAGFWTSWTIYHMGLINLF